MRQRSAEHPFLLIPGPTEVHPDVARAGTRPMIGHRGPEIREMLARDLPRVQSLLGTSSSVYPLACSATGAMEAAVRNAGPGPFLHLVCGAFSARWSEVRARCGFEGDDLVVDWGKAVRAGAVSEALEGRSYAAVTLVHSETSTGVLNPLAEIAQAVAEHPDTLLLVDTVSSMAAVELKLDAWGVDVCFAGVQKAWALPAGLTLCAVSPRALARSAAAPGKGFYFDFELHERALERWQTPSTPPISLLFQLSAALDRIDAEGAAARYARHRALQARVLDWADGRFEPFAEAGFRSPALTALRAGRADLPERLQGMRRRGWTVAPGYGPTRTDLFRIGHMGELDLETLERALADMDAEFARGS